MIVWLAASAGLASPHLCVGAGEVVAFSCALEGGEIASLCTDEDGAWLELRHGRAGAPPTLTWPDVREGSAARFDVDSTWIGGHGNDHVSVTHDERTLTLSTYTDTSSGSRSSAFTVTPPGTERPCVDSEG